MILDFNKMPDLTWTDFRGGEEDTIARMYKDSKNQIMFLKLEPGASMGVYNHENSTEIIYVLQGSATATFDGIEEELYRVCVHTVRQVTQTALKTQVQRIWCFFRWFQDLKENRGNKWTMQ